MSIKKMLLLAGMALAAIAFAAPAVAQANVLLTEDEVPLENGAEITATSTDLKTVTSLGTLTCGKVTLHFEVKENGGETGHVLLDPVGGATTENCIVDLPEEKTAPVTITDGTVLSPLTINTWGTGYAAASFVSDIGPLTCTFSGAVHTQATTNGGDVLNIAGSPLAGVGPGCSAQGQISGNFTLETNDKDNTPIEIDFKKTN